MDRLSSQWVTSWPTPTIELSDLEMPEVITTYLGRESPAVRHLAGRSIPCGRVRRVCDVYGFQIGLATLPGVDDTICHDACSRELFDIITEARLRIELQPRTIFSTVIPTAVLIASRTPPAIVPDAAIDVALPAVVTARGQRRGSRLLLRRLLFDVKTIHAGTEHYTSAHARDEQSGAVRHREAGVAHDYTSHARRLDRTYHPHTGTPGPIEQRLRSFTTVRGLVFGQYAEASADVHDLIATAADGIAQHRWQLAGARSATEMRAFLVSRCRRRVGLVAAQAMARHRLARVPYIGVPRDIVATRMQRGPQRRGHAHPYAPAPDHADFYQYQAHAPALVAAA